MSDRTKLTSHLVLLIALCGILYFPYLGNVSFFDKGEPREALAVQDIVQRGEWLFPLKRATAIPSNRRYFTGRRRWLPKSQVNWTRPLSGFRLPFMPRSVSSLSMFSAESYMAG